MELYKFRPYNEYLYESLEKQYIYFSGLKSLNDPMEGIKTLYWKGSKAQWLKIFEFYFLCLYYLFDKNFKSLHELDFSFKKYNIKRDNDLLLKVSNLFIKNKDIQKYASLLSNKKFYKDVLNAYFIGISQYAIKIIREIKGEDKPKDDTIKSFNDFINQNIKYSFSDRFNPNNYLEKIVKLNSDLHLNKSIYFKYDLYFLKSFTKDKGPLNKWPAVKLPEYSEQFLEILENIINEEILLSSFSLSYSNPIMWSHYASNHQGICLIFDYKSLTDNLNERYYLFDKVKYRKNYKEINFFDIVNFNNQFHIDIEKYSQIYKTKLRNWDYEKEFRILNIDRETYRNKQKLFYNSQTLIGIIFGSKTSGDFKEKVIKMFIKDRNFKFYEAYYSKYTGQIEKIDLKPSMERVGSNLRRLVNQWY